VIEKQLSEQAEAICSTNKTLAQLFTLMRNIELKRVATPPLATTTITPPVSTTLSISHTSRIELGVPNNFNGD
jgi:hypothetical protein